jgi:hypothetical protein
MCQHPAVFLLCCPRAPSLPARLPAHLLQAECDELQRQLLETQRLLEGSRRELKHAFEQVEEARGEADARTADAEAAGECKGCRMLLLLAD